ncbi:MAG: N-acetylmannosaminyltransferase [Candidatus Carbobacillus altaicus]|uniref:N-acetylmannosaminyltransferase n=1 Tax=Candidatus Carbonibacillus altaicus TaxID=2163959 RepID=A0A2R6XX74_9BACL|nr:MAG: N-acetylmannosaminyltransferase [Candidatus Carbobacillus altaicus]
MHTMLTDLTEWLIDCLKARDFSSRTLPRGLKISTVNAEMIMQMRRDPSFDRDVRSADLIIPDGVGISYAARVLKNMHLERIAGIDLMTALIARAHEEGMRVFLLGAHPDVIRQVEANLKRQYPNLRLGVHHGYLEPDEEITLLEKIHAFAPDFIFVGMGAARQERWIEAHRAAFPATLMMGVGGSFDVLAGKVRRAPKTWQRLGLEWLWRLKEEPWRIRRMRVLPLFVLFVWGAKIGIVRSTDYGT